jgi:hypothetical protein
MENWAKSIGANLISECEMSIGDPNQFHHPLEYVHSSSEKIKLFELLGKNNFTHEELEKIKEEEDKKDEEYIKKQNLYNKYIKDKPIKKHLLHVDLNFHFDKKNK